MESYTKDIKLIITDNLDKDYLTIPGLAIAARRLSIDLIEPLDSQTESVSTEHFSSVFKVLKQRSFELFQAAKALPLKERIRFYSELSNEIALEIHGSENTLTLPDPVYDKYELWRNRTNKDEKPLDFLNRVWGDYIAAGLLFQSDLRGQTKTLSNPNPKPALDKTLFELVSRQCKEENLDIKIYLPTKSQKINNKAAKMQSLGLVLQETSTVTSSLKMRDYRASKSKSNT